MVPCACAGVPVPVRIAAGGGRDAFRARRVDVATSITTCRSRAHAADEAGFATFCLGDSIFYPEVAVARYPYTETGDRSFLDGAPFLDPFQLIAAMSVVAGRIHFQTGVLKLPIRDRFSSPSRSAPWAVLTGERLVFGFGLSPWIEDFRGTGTDWASRGARMDEMLQIIRGLIDRRVLRVAQRALRHPPRQALSDAVVLSPDHHRGAQPGRRTAARARHADGFSFISLTEEELAGRLAYIREQRRELGREGEPFRVFAGLATVQTLDDVRRVGSSASPTWSSAAGTRTRPTPCRSTGSSTGCGASATR